MGIFSGARRPAPVAERSTITGLSPITMQGFNFAALTLPEVNETAATQSVAIRTSIDLICSLTSELPVHVYRGEGAERQQLTLPRNLEDPGDTGQGLEDWIYSLVQSWLYRGNAYGRVTDRLANGNPARIELFHPDDVTAQVDSGRTVWLINGTPAPDQSAILHRRANPMAGRLIGLSPIQEHATQIGSALAAARYGNQWFRDGAHPSALLTNTEATIDTATANIVKDRWLGLFRGNREPAVLGKGWEYKPISVTAEESQFLATMRYSETQCARIFGPGVAEILGYETGHSLTYTTVVDRRSDLLAFTLNKWLRRAERLLTEMTPRPQYVRFDRDALLESATLARYEAHAKALQNRWKTVNEVRDDEDMPAVPWGDEPNETGAHVQPAKGVTTDGVTAGD
jgi:HK97 family phage portal protein